MVGERGKSKVLLRKGERVRCGWGKGKGKVWLGKG